MSSEDAKAFSEAAVDLLESLGTKVVEHNINHYAAGNFFTITCETSNKGHSVSEVGESLQKNLESQAYAFFGEANYRVEILPV